MLRVALGVVLCAILFAPVGASAVDDAAAADAPAGDVAAPPEVTEEEFRELSNDVVRPDEPPEPPPEDVMGPAPPARAFSIRWDQGLRIERNDRSFRLKVGGRLLLDAAYTNGSSAIESMFDHGWDTGTRQARVDFTGTLGARVFFKAAFDVSGDAGDNNRNRLLNDFFIGLKGVAGSGSATAKVGVVREPFAMGQQSSALSLVFMERALPLAFAPGFNPGILIQNTHRDRSLTWTVGAFRYVGEDSDQNRNDFSARVTAVPVFGYQDRWLLHVGAATSYQDGGSYELRYRRRPETHLGSRWVNTGKLKVDRTHLVGLEIAGLADSLSFQAELLYSRVDPKASSAVAFWGGYAEVAYLLTGERRPYQRRNGVFGRVHPNESFDWKAGTWGALEVAVRYSYLDLDDGPIRGGTLGDVTFGINWYASPTLRFMLNYVHANRNGVGDGHVFAGRFQIAY